MRCRRLRRLAVKHEVGVFVGLKPGSDGGRGEVDAELLQGGRGAAGKGVERAREQRPDRMAITPLGPYLRRVAWEQLWCAKARLRI